jgi:aminotransferase
MRPLSDRTAHFNESLIRRMTRISNECGAINLSQGFPDFDPPKILMDRLAEVAYDGPHQYPITWGAPNFRAAVANKQSRFMDRPLDPNENVLITIGSTEAMVDSLMALCDPGDKVGEMAHSGLGKMPIGPSAPRKSRCIFLRWRIVGIALPRC